MNRSLCALLAAGALVLVATPAHAYVTETTKWNPSTLPIPYNVNTGSIASEIASTGVGSVDAGFTTWGGPSCTTWRASNAGSTTRGANGSDRLNTILWLNSSWPAELGSVGTVIGVTTPVWTVGGYFFDADIQFNGVGFTWSTTGAGGTVDTQSIATHEEGHFLGLDHSPVRGAIMAAAYAGGLVRTLSADDQSGVCYLYPSGVAPMDAGVPPFDAGSSTDRCTPLGGTCDTCTPNGGCGWCGALGACISGTGTSPPASCASGWAWYPMDCAGGMTGTGRIGDPCMAAGDCGTGLCVTTDGVHGFCTHACTDDCGCEGGYTCYTSGTLSACINGTNACPTPPVDAGTPPGMDSGIPPGTDAGIPPGTDAGIPPGTDGGPGTMDGGGAGTDAGGRGPPRRGGCCSVPGNGVSTTEAGFASLALVALAGVVRIRRRKR